MEDGGGSKSSLHHLKKAVPGFLPLKIAGLIMLVIALIMVASGLGVMANQSFVSGAIVTFVGFCLGYGGYHLIKHD